MNRNNKARNIFFGLLMMIIGLSCYAQDATVEVKKRNAITIQNIQERNLLSATHMTQLNLNLLLSIGLTALLPSLIAVSY